MVAVTEASPPRIVKSEAAFRTISEVSEELDVPQHVLRFWESRFPQIKPLKRGGGRRYYRPADVVLLRRIRDLLYQDGYTIKGVQKLLRDGLLKGETPAPLPPLAEEIVADFDHAPEPVAIPPQPTPQPPDAPVAVGLNPGQKTELKSILGDLKALRQILHDPSD